MSPLNHKIPVLLVGALVFIAAGRLSAQSTAASRPPAQTAPTNPIDIANEIERLRAENAALEDGMDPAVALALVRQENADIKLRNSGPQTLAEVKQVLLTALQKPFVTPVAAAGGGARRGGGPQQASGRPGLNEYAYLEICADANEPQHSAALKDLHTALPNLEKMISAAVVQFANLPPTENSDETSARHIFGARLTAAQQMCADVAATPHDTKEEWRYPIRDLLIAIQPQFQ